MSSKRNRAHEFWKMFSESFMSVRDIAESVGCSDKHVFHTLKAAGYQIPKYPRIGYSDPELRSKERFIALLQSCSTVSEVARKKSLTDVVIRSWCKFHELKPKEWMQPYKGDKRFNWKGGRFKDKNGYVRVLCNTIGYQEFNPSWKCHHTLEHKALVEMQSVGFPLPTSYVIHHINQEPSDNRLENLAVLTWAQHVQIHSLLEKGETFKDKILEVTKQLSSTNIQNLQAARRLHQLLAIYQEE